MTRPVPQASVPSGSGAQARVGVDESGKGDFFGPLVVAAAYADASLEPALRDAGTRDSKLLGSDEEALAVAREIEAILGPGRYAVLCVGCGPYNRIYAKERSLNKMLAAAHARCVAKVLEAVPDCRLAVSDQFGDCTAVAAQLVARGRGDVAVDSRPRAESDTAVAAASILARARFIREMAQLRETSGLPVPLGCVTGIVVPAGIALARKVGPAGLVDFCKCHFKTLEKVLAGVGASRADMPPEGRVKSIPPSAARRRAAAKKAAAAAAEGGAE